ncbi:hypothetical protein LTR66_016102, partial [Elasticomyces elasticus]
PTRVVICVKALIPAVKHTSRDLRDLFDQAQNRYVNSSVTPAILDDERVRGRSIWLVGWTQARLKISNLEIPTSMVELHLRPTVQFQGNSTAQQNQDKCYGIIIRPSTIAWYQAQLPKLESLVLTGSREAWSKPYSKFANEIRLGNLLGEDDECKAGLEDFGKRELQLRTSGCFTLDKLPADFSVTFSVTQNLDWT